MNLTSQMEQTKKSAVFTGETFCFSKNESLSNISQQLDTLIDRRKESVNIIADIDLRNTLIKISEVLCCHILNYNKVLVAGNGGSASQSQHFCSELMGRLKRRRSPIQAISLCSDTSLITCIANDFGYERVFSRQIEGLGNANDIFIGFTTSGKSRNIVEALLECKSRNILTIIFTGKTSDSIKNLADFVVEIPIEDAAIVQEIHMQLIHILCEIIENNIQANDTVWKEVIELGQQGYKHLILDRDGVINYIKANGYIKSPSEFIPREDFLQNIKQLSETFHNIFVVSNQKGIGKGCLSFEELEVVHKKMNNEISYWGGRIDRIYVGINAADDAIENKPNIGMADLIKKDFPEVDFSQAIVVGDSMSDYLFAKNLQSKFIYVRTR